MIDWDHDRMAAFDVETSGVRKEFSLQPWRMRQGKAWLTSIAVVVRPDIQFGGLFPTKDQLVEFLRWCIAGERRVVGWNVSFDIAWLLAHGLEELVMQIKWLDGMLLWMHHDREPEYETSRGQRRSYGLKQSVAIVLPQFAGYAEDVDFHSRDPEELAKLQAYNYRDTGYTLYCAWHWWQKLSKRQRACALAEAEMLPVVAQANLEGMPVDTLVTRELSAHLTETATARLADLAPHGVSEAVVRSPKKLGELLFDQWGLPVLKENTGKKTGIVSRATDKEVLHELAFLDPRAKLLRQYRESLNNRKKFADTLLDSVDYNEDGCVHPQAFPYSTYTGRLTYASKQDVIVPGAREGTTKKGEAPIGFALHQEKRGPVFRSVLIAPPGYDLVEFDAAGQEFRWMAEASGDVAMKQLCQPGEDPHCFLGARIADVDYKTLIAQQDDKDIEIKKPAEQKRYLGKIGNFCCIRDTPILTDRGHVAIQDVKKTDRVWDGVEFVQHDGVVFSGVKRVMHYDGVIATPRHEVLVDGCWQMLEVTARHRWAIEPSLGAGWADRARTTVRVLDGIVGRAFCEIWVALRSRAMRLRERARRQLTFSGDWTLARVSVVFDAAQAPARGASFSGVEGRREAAKACERVVPAVQQSEGCVVSQLRRPWDRMQVRDGAGGCRVHQDIFAASDVSRAGHRSHGQRRALRARQPATGDAQAKLAQHAPEPLGYMAWGEGAGAGVAQSVFVTLHAALCGSRAFWRRYPCAGTSGCSGETQELAHHPTEAEVFDIMNCGPRNRFAANGRLVHNSLAYRTSAKRLRVTARVDYDVQLELPEAELIHAVYRQSYPGVPAYWRNQIALVKGLGYVETFAGRRVRVEGDWTGNMGWFMGSTAINHRIQGTGGDQKCLAIAVLKTILPKYDARFAWDLHDGLYWYVPSHHTKSFVAEGQRLLDNLPYKQAWGFTPSIPMPWDAKSGGSWGSMKKVQL